MKKIIFIVVTLITAFSNINGQITKGNWMIGGNASISKLSQKSDIAVNFTETRFNIYPSVGYFLADKFCAGLQPSFEHVRAKASGTSKATNISVGPFARYYVLKQEGIVNLLVEGSFKYGNSKGNASSNSNFTQFSFSGGPVMFFNSSVGLEMLFSYSSLNFKGVVSNTTDLRLSVGFKFHFEKEK